MLLGLEDSTVGRMFEDLISTPECTNGWEDKEILEAWDDVKKTDSAWEMITEVVLLL